MILAAASSIASGSPSSRAQISATMGAVASVSSKSGRTALARSAKSATASFVASAAAFDRWSYSGRRSVGTRYSCSPWTRSGARLVTRSSTSDPPREVGDDRRGAKQVLEIVQNQQGFPLGEEAMDLIDQRPGIHLAQAKCRCQSRARPGPDLATRERSTKTAPPLNEDASRSPT